jgi:hypothetical protein
MSDKAIRDPRSLTDRLIEAGEKWSDLNAAAEMLEETKKTLLAQITSGFMAEQSMSVAKAETLALASNEYGRHLKAMVEARQLANKARVRYDSGKAFVELARSAEATRRSEMNLGSRIT